MSEPTRTQAPLTGARGQRPWYRLEQRHQALLALRGVLAVLVAALALIAAGPLDLDTGARLAIVLACAGVVTLHFALHLLARQYPRTLRATVDAGLILDAAFVFAIAALSGHLESPALWLIPVLAVAFALGLSALSGLKALVAFAIATAGVAATGPAGDPLATGLAPLGVAAACVLVAAAMSDVNERELRDRGDRVDVLHDASLAFVAARDPDELATIASAAAERLLAGWDVEVALGAPAGPARTWRSDGRVNLALPIATPAHEGFDDAEHAHGALRASRAVPRSARAVTVRGQQLRALETLCTGLATALSQVELMHRLERLSLVDPLTGLGNRRSFDRSLEIELARSRRSGAPLAVVMVDVDHFKRFNDTHGHQAGDRALAAVGACLARVGRREDSACRIGGEEFALLLGGAGEAAAAEVAERARLAVAGISLPEGSVSVSLGVASVGGDSDPAALVALADRRLYEAKRQGRDRVVTGEPVGSSSAPARPATETAP